MTTQLYDALYNQFGLQIQQTAGIVSNELKTQIINARRSFLTQFLALPVSLPDPPPSASAATGFPAVKYV